MKSVRVGSIAGIPILISPSWLIPVAVVVWFLSLHIYPDMLEDAPAAVYVAMAVASALLFFVSLVLHELAHSLVARRYGIPVRSITLFLLGGVAQIARDPRSAKAEFLIAIAGPATSLAIGSILIGGWLVIGIASSAFASVMLWLGAMNIVVGVFNLLPIFPMDGGRIFRSMMWGATKDPVRSTSIAAWSGRVIAWAMIAASAAVLAGADLGLLRGTTDGLWFLMIGFFLESSARQSLVQNRFIARLSTYRASDIMTAEPPVVSGETSVAALARGVLEINPRVCYFIEEGGKLAGIVSRHEMIAVPEPDWESTTAVQAMTPRSALHAAGPETLASELLVEMESEDLHHIAVVSDDTVVGVVGRERIVGILQKAGLLGEAPA